MTTSATFVQYINWQMVNLTTHPQTNASSFHLTESNHRSLSLTLRALFKTGHCQHKHEVTLLISSWFTGSLAPAKETPSHLVAQIGKPLMPRCHCQYIQTMMMFPHKYFMSYTASKTHSAWMEEETCILSLLKGSQLKVNKKKSLDEPHHEG